MFSSESRALQRWIRDASAGVFAGAVCVERPQIRREAVRGGRAPRARRSGRVECMVSVKRGLDCKEFERSLRKDARTAVGASTFCDDESQLARGRGR